MTRSETLSPPPAGAKADMPHLELRNVSKHFTKQSDIIGKIAEKSGLTRPASVLRAVDDVSLEVAKGEVLGLVGESGCGKSTLGRVIVDLLTPTSGEVRIKGRALSEMSAAQRAEARLRTQMIFQNPYASLNPRHPVSRIIGEAPRLNGLVKGARATKEHVATQMAQAGLDPEMSGRYPHQFSGGQRQRIGIARALAVQPDLLVCDESVAALDVSIQAQIINLFMSLRTEFDLTYLFISHDLGVVEHISDRVAIMYLGRIVEQAPVAEIFERPNHPYTQALLKEVPRISTRKKVFKPLEGEIPSPLDPPKGCHFHPRCPHAFDRCRAERPALKAVASGHVSACHLNDVQA
ncbi:MAG: ATP-binding cassette domain-containing protein [Rhodobacteraceae bacterium]|nr:MAG: ATP-binding cassette domain-containing protein [Paracoccaceae bacterium]